MWTNVIEWTNSIQNNKLDFFNMENIINVYDSDDIDIDDYWLTLFGFHSNSFIRLLNTELY